PGCRCSKGRARRRRASMEASWLPRIRQSRDARGASRAKTEEEHDVRRSAMTPIAAHLDHVKHEARRPSTNREIRQRRVKRVSQPGRALQRLSNDGHLGKGAVHDVLDGATDAIERLYAAQTPNDRALLHEAGSLWRKNSFSEDEPGRTPAGPSAPTQQIRDRDRRRTFWAISHCREGSISRQSSTSAQRGWR